MGSPVPLLLAGAAVFAFSSRKPRRKKSTKPCPPLDLSGGRLAGFDYIEFTTGGADPSGTLPMIVFFHSLASEPKSLAKYLKDLPGRARVIMPRGNATWGRGPAWWPMRSKTEDQDALADAMTNVGRQMRDFIREVSRCRPTLGKPVVVGHSQGGMMSYAVAAVNPSGVKAAVPASGWLPRQMWPRKIAPTIALHGTQDLTVPYGRTADFIARAQSAGLPIEFIAITGQGHGLSGELRSKWKSAIDRVMRTGIA